MSAVHALNMGWEDWAGNFCYLILAFSYLVTNLYWLRLLAILALALEGMYFYCASTPPLWVGIAWAIVFVGINLSQIAFMSRERLRIRISEQERRLRDAIFPDMALSKFRRLIKIGSWREIGKGCYLTIEGEPVLELLFIAQGRIRVRSNGRVLPDLVAGAIVGEKSFLCGGNASATVLAETSLTVFAVSKIALHALIRHDHGVEAAIFKAIGQGLSSKLHALCRVPDQAQPGIALPNSVLPKSLGSALSRDADILTTELTGVPS